MDRLVISYSQKPNKELKDKTFLYSLCLKYASKEFKCSLFKILKILHKKINIRWCKNWQQKYMEC